MGKLVQASSIDINFVIVEGDRRLESMSEELPTNHLIPIKIEVVTKFDQITDEQQLEQIMDGLCDFCDEIRFIDFYRSLCRHIYYQYPQLVGEHVALFRALFEGPDES